MTQQEKWKEVVGINEIIELTHDVSPMESFMGDPSNVYYNVLDHIINLPTKLSCYDIFILSKEIKDSLVKELLYLEIYLAKMNDASQAKDKEILRDTREYISWFLFTIKAYYA